MRLKATWLLPLVLLACCAALQAQRAQNPTAENAAGSQEQPADPLGRETPQGTLIGFLKAARDGNYDLAAQYFQSTLRRQSQQQDTTLAGQLQIVLDQLFLRNLNTVSQSPVGDLNDGLPRDRENLGKLRIGHQEMDLHLVQVSEAQGNRIWLFDWQSLRQVPGIYEQLLVPKLVNELVPSALIETRLLSMPLWLWLAIILFSFLAFGLAWILMLVLRAARMLIRKTRGRPLPAPHGLFRISPVTLLVALCLHFLLLDRVVGLPVLYRQIYMEVMALLIAVTLYWLVARLTDDFAGLIGKRLVSSGRSGAHSLLILGTRVFKFVFALALILATVRWFGIDVTTALAGLGIGGLALGLGAQKTLDNFFGGITVLTDDALRVGDLCKIGDQLGTVEDVSLRSTLLRRADRVIVSIPNGQVAQASIENYSRRDGLLFRATIGLRYETSSDQLQAILAGIQEMLNAHPKVDKNQSFWARLTGLGNSSYTVDISALIRETQFMSFLPVQEELLLRIVKIVEEAGTSLALPAQTVYTAPAQPALK